MKQDLTEEHEFTLGKWLIITDPGRDKGDGYIRRCVAGKWKMFVDRSVDGIVRRVEYVSAQATDSRDSVIPSRTVYCDVRTGLLGVFNSKLYPKKTGYYDDRNSFYGHVCSLLNVSPAGVSKVGALTRAIDNEEYEVDLWEKGGIVYRVFVEFQTPVEALEFDLWCAHADTIPPPKKRQESQSELEQRIRIIHDSICEYLSAVHCVPPEGFRGDLLMLLAVGSVTRELSGEREKNEKLSRKHNRATQKIRDLIKSEK